MSSAASRTASQRLGWEWMVATISSAVSSSFIASVAFWYRVTQYMTLGYALRTSYQSPCQGSRWNHNSESVPAMSRNITAAAVNRAVSSVC